MANTPKVTDPAEGPSFVDEYMSDSLELPGLADDAALEIFRQTPFLHQGVKTK